MEVLKEICNDPDLNQITTFAYSTASSEIYKAKCIDLGAKAFLTKPTEISAFDDIPQQIIQIAFNNL